MGSVSFYQYQNKFFMIFFIVLWINLYDFFLTVVLCGTVRCFVFRVPSFRVFKDLKAQARWGVVGLTLGSWFNNEEVGLISLNPYYVSPKDCSFIRGRIFCATGFSRYATKEGREGKDLQTPANLAFRRKVNWQENSPQSTCYEY